MSHKRRLQLAAGMVLLRKLNKTTQVALVHRPHYDDWTLPKGKPFTDELLPVTASREVREETGYDTILDAPIGQSDYLTGERIKRIYWWRGYLLDSIQHRLDAEVDQVEWLTIDRARKRLTYCDDVKILVKAIKLPKTLPFLVIRHAKAMSRKNWSGTDADRRLDERGRRQAKRIADLLHAYGVPLLASSSSTRCVATLSPYAKRNGLTIDALPSLSEEGAAANPNNVRPTIDALRKLAIDQKLPLAVCGHRPVLPLMVESLDCHYQPMKPAEVLAVHLDHSGKAHCIERIPPRF